MSERVMIITTTPAETVDAILTAISSAGGGIVGDYTHCAFTSTGNGRFKPADTAQPHVGQIGQINTEPETRIETFCDRQSARAVVQAIRSAHPYEEPVIYIVPILDESDL